MSRIVCDEFPQLQRRLSLLAVVVLTELFHSSHGDVGTAARYSPPYSPTVCYANDPSQFPSSNLLAAAGDGIWDNGAACGRQYVDGTSPSPPSASGKTMAFSDVNMS